MKRFISVLSVIGILLAIFSQAVFADGNIISSASFDNGVVRVELSEGTAAAAGISINKGGEQIYADSKSVSGTSFEFGLHVRNIPNDTYLIVIHCYNDAGEVIGEYSLSATFGSASPLDLQEGENNPLHASRAVMQPYANVYADASMGVKIASLKRYDYVHIISSDDIIAKVSYRIQSGNGTTSKIDGTHAIYNSDDDLCGIGYMYMSSFQKTEEAMRLEDKQRDVAEIAYSRLGTQGVYNQSLRYQDNYVDCAALAAYCWYQVGYDLSTDGNTACSGLAQWGKDNNAVLWRAGESPDPEGRLAQIASIDYSDLDEDGDGEIDEGKIPDIPVIFFYGAGGGVYGMDDIIYFSRSFDPNTFKKLQPGDLIFFNYEIQVRPPEGDYFNTRTSNTYNHVAIFIGCKTSSSGDVLSVQYIEAANPNENTKITTIAPSEISRDIALVVRPTGCEELIEGIISIIPANLENWVRPLESCIITSHYGMRIHPITHLPAFHNGLDLAAGFGTPIYAACDGVVMSAGPNGGLGNCVIINHGNGYVTMYGHMSQCIAHAGQAVKAGDVIGLAGSTGNSTGPHLHWTIQYNGTTIDPEAIVRSLPSPTAPHNNP